MKPVGWFFGIDAGIGLGFLACAIWSYKKPATAFITALIFYILVHVCLSILDPTNIVKGIILKILVIVALYKAYKDARDNEELKRALSAE